MATKAQKRAAALEKRARFLATHKELGLAAQQRDREARKTREEEYAELAFQHDVSLTMLLIALSTR